MRLAPLLLLALLGCRPADAGTTELQAIVGEPDALTGGFRIIDGDTFALGSETIRISNIDAPEMPPRARCWAEARLARAAATELDRIRGQSPDLGQFRITREGQDRYGRTLARVTFDGETDAGEIMIANGYASPWTGRRWDWCGAVTADPNGAAIVAGPAPALASVTGR